MINVRRFFVHVQPFFPQLFEAHIFIDPFYFKLGGVTLLALTGLEGDQKKNAQKNRAEAEKARAEAEALALAKWEAEQRGLELEISEKTKKKVWPTVCKERECMTCARQLENTGSMRLKCGT